MSVKHGKMVPEKDKYGRLLVDIHLLERDDHEVVLLAELVASVGHTFPILDGGVDSGVLSMMEKAKEARLGSFQLPKETRMSPFRTWDVRNNRLFIMVKSPLANEGLLYAAPSTIPRAGMGLLLMPRHFDLLAGSYLCKYATSFTR
jgi:hypothetical protein